MYIKQINQLLDDRGVSPVVGLILMVAIVVILSAVIGTFVLDLGGTVEEPAQAGVGLSQTDDGVKVTVYDMGNTEKLYVSVNGEKVNNSELTRSGETVTISTNEGDDVSVISDKEGSKQVIVSESATQDTLSSGEPSVVSDGESDENTATVSSYGVPLGFSTQSALDEFESDSSESLRSSDGYPIIVSNLSTTVKYTTDSINTSNVDEIDVVVDGVVNSGDERLDVQYRPNVEDRTTKSTNLGTPVTFTSVTDTTKFQFTPAYDNNHTIKSISLSAYNVTTETGDFPEVFNTTTAFTEYRTGDGDANVSSGAIEFTDGGVYEFEQIQTSSSLDEVIVTLDGQTPQNKSSNLELRVSDSSGNTIGTTTTSKISDALGSNNISDYENLTVEIVMQSGDVTINQVSVKGYTYTSTENTLTSPMTTSSEFNTYKNTSSNATVQDDKITLNQNADRTSTVYYTKDFGYSQNIDVVRTTIKTSYSNNGVNYELQAPSDYDGYPYGAEEMDKRQYAINNTRVIEHTDGDFISVGDSDYRIKLSTSPYYGEINVSEVFITGIDVSYNQQFNLSTQSELSAGNWNNNTVVENGKIKFEDGSTTSDAYGFYETSETVTLDNSSQQLVVEFKGDMNVDSGVTVNYGGVNRTVPIYKSDAVVFNKDGASVTDTVTLYVNEQSDSVNTTISSLNVSVRNEDEIVNFATTSTSESPFDIQYTNKTRTEITTQNVTETN